MTEWWEKILQDVPIDKVLALLKEYGVAKDHSTQQSIFENIALCRLAFSSIVNTTEPLPPFGILDEAIISSTRLGMSRGRPKTARWAFWVAYIIKQGLNTKENQITAKTLSCLIELLLGRDFTAEKVRTEFVGLKKTAERHATEFAEAFLNRPMQQNSRENQFKKNIISDFSKDLTPDSKMLPIIDNGKINDQWLEEIVKTRKAILRRVKRNGPLGGKAPLVEITSLTSVFKGVPLTFPSTGASSEKVGAIHLGKSGQIPVPPSISEQERAKGAEMSLNIDGEGGTTSIGFPEYFLEVDEPFMAALYAVPVWWHEWRALFVARL